MTTYLPSSRPDLDLAHIRRRLEQVEADRQRQLDGLPTPPPNPVAALHRESVQRLLTQIRAARQRIDAGTYGTCVDCEQPIPAERLDLHLWAATCLRCARR